VLSRHKENKMQEVWKQVRNYNYSISNLGNLRNDASGLITKGSLQNGYRSFSLRHEGVVLGLFKIHRLVAEVFIPNTLAKTQVNHLNGIRDDNRAENLEWATPRENVQHAYDTGLMLRGSGRPEAILTEVDIPEIIYYMSVGYKDAAIAAAYGVTRQTINAIRIGDNWKHLGLEIIGRYEGKTRERKLTVNDIPNIRARFAANEGDTSIAKDYGVHQGTVRQIRIGNTWKNY
jgi:hypothetical protein